MVIYIDISLNTEQNTEPMTKSKTMYVVANTINSKHISYTCPVCKKRKKHLCGSNGELFNRIETRQCRQHIFKDTKYKYVVIRITDATKRV